MMIRNAKEVYSYCTKCCFDCDRLQTCGTSCTLAAGRKKELKNAAKEANRAAAERAAALEEPIIEYIKGVYNRVGKARMSVGVSVKELYDAQGRYYATTDVQKQVDLESGEAKFSPYTSLPFGYPFYQDQAKILCAVADLLHCTTDYLLGREENVSNLDTWKRGAPEKPGTYIVFARYCDGGKRTPDEMEWDGERWMHFGQDVAALGVKVYAWIERPEIEEPQETSLNDACSTGLSPSGHCGAAACCAEPYACCADCPDPCNSECGWITKGG